MEPERIAALFTREDGSFLCARWGRPVAPVIFGLAVRHVVLGENERSSQVPVRRRQPVAQKVVRV